MTKKKYYWASSILFYFSLSKKMHYPTGFLPVQEGQGVDKNQNSDFDFSIFFLWISKVDIPWTPDQLFFSRYHDFSIKKKV